MQKLTDLIQKQLEETFHPTHLNLVDDSESHAGHAGNRGGAHLTLHIVSALFEGKTPVQRHRLVYQALAPWMEQEIHALSIQAQTPLEFISTRNPA